MDPVPDLAQRYRRPGRLQRMVALVIIGALVVSGVGLLAWSVVFESTPQVQSELTGFEVKDEHAVDATFTVTRKSEFTKASCRLQAISADHAVVGDLDVPVTDGATKRTVAVEIRTERRAAAVDLLGCTTPDQSRPR
jgi:hypothetical protein